MDNGLISREKAKAIKRMDRKALTDYIQRVWADGYEHGKNPAVKKTMIEASAERKIEKQTR